MWWSSGGGEGDASRVRIETIWQGAGGIGGLVERLFAPLVVRRLYADELARLDRYVRRQAAPSPLPPRGA